MQSFELDEVHGELDQANAIIDRLKAERDALQKAGKGLAEAAKKCRIWQSRTFYDGESGIPAFVHETGDALADWRKATGA